MSASPGLAQWLVEKNVSLAFTTYQLGKLFFLSAPDAEKLVVSDQSFPRCMGLAMAPDNSLWMSSLNQMFHLTNAVPPGRLHDGHDALFVPRRSWVSGELDIHDIIIAKDDRPIFVNTRFNCLSRLADGYSFGEHWRPPFISDLVAEDRCHLNGLTAEDGAPRFVTMAAQTDNKGGWREDRIGAGVVMSVPEAEVVTTGLTMPHSPRLKDGKLWVLNSGHGYFGVCDPEDGRFSPVAFCPGFARGMSFIDDVVVIGLSKPRRDGAFDDLPLKENLARHNAEAICGLIFVSLHDGSLLHWVRLDGDVQELYDVVALPGVRRPSALSFFTQEINRVIAVAPRQA